MHLAPGRWLHAVRANFGADAPPVEARAMTGVAPAPIPSHRAHDARLFARLLAA